MIDTSEDRDTVKPEIEEPVEEVQISEEAQQIAEDAESDAIEESQAEEATPEASAEPSAEEQAAEMKDRLLRALADVENTRVARHAILRMPASTPPAVRERPAQCIR